MNQPHYFWIEDPISILDVIRLRIAIRDARGTLERNPTDPGLAAGMIKMQPALQKTGLVELAWLLDSGRYGCHRNDVLGLFELAEAWIHDMLMHVAASRIHGSYHHSALVIPDQNIAEDHQNSVNFYAGA